MQMKATMIEEEKDFNSKIWDKAYLMFQGLIRERDNG